MALGLSARCSICGCVDSSCSSCTAPSKCLNCVSCCCGAIHTAWRQNRLRDGLRLEYISLVWMGVEAIWSLGAGILAASLALVAFGGDSVVELLSSLVVARHLGDDAAGSQGLGNRTSQVSSVLLLLLVPTLGFGAGYSYLNGIRPEGSLPGLIVAAGASVVMPYLWLRKRKIGDETRCLPLQIDAIESATCFFMSLALLGGLLAEFFFGLWWADYLATGAILTFVLKEGVESYREARFSTLAQPVVGPATTGL